MISHAPETNLRPELSHHLAQRLQAFGEGFRQNLAIIGQPGSGKTFQLQQLLAQRPPALIAIYCALYRESCRSFLSRLLGAILQAGLPEAARLSLPSETATPQPPLEALLQRVDSQIPRTAAAVRAVQPLLARRLYGEAFNRTLDTIPILLEERRACCVLMLDEFLCLEELGLSHVFHELGKRVMTWPSTLFLLTSSCPTRARTILRERLHLLFGQFELLTLERLDPAATAAWIQEALKGIRGVKTVTPFLMQWLGAYPWYLAVVLKRLKELVALSKRSDVTEALLLQTLWDLLGSAEGPLHHWCASRIEGLSRHRLGTRAIEALIHVAEGARTTTEISRRIGRAGLTGALQLLLEQDLVERNGMCWMVPDPIMRCWLSTILSAQRSDVRPADRDVRERFDETVRAFWMGWMQTHALSFSEQVAGLFGKFCDDTVSLDSKTGRLPKFESVIVRPPERPTAETYVIAEGQGKRWCASVQEGPLDEQAIASFDAFCRSQSPRPTRKVVITKASMDQTAKLLAKAANMWVWEAGELNVLMQLFGQV